MSGLFQLLLLLFLYSNIWMVPAHLSYKRQKLGKPRYWMLLVGVMAVEILIVYALIYLSQFLMLSEFAYYIAPAISSIVAGFLYWRTAEKLDLSAVNNQMNKGVQAVEKPP